MAMVRKHKYNKTKNKVYWVFECGCVYKGHYYTTNGRRLCFECRTLLIWEYIKCKNCGAIEKFKVKGRASVFCVKCKKEKNRNYVPKKKVQTLINKKCSTPGCNKNVGKGKRFLCDIHYKG